MALHTQPLPEAQITGELSTSPPVLKAISRSNPSMTSACWSSVGASLTAKLITPAR